MVVSRVWRKVKSDREAQPHLGRPSAPPCDGRNGEAPADPVEEMAAKPPSAQSRPTCPRLAAEMSWLLASPRQR